MIHEKRIEVIDDDVDDTRNLASNPVQRSILILYRLIIRLTVNYDELLL